MFFFAFESIFFSFSELSYQEKKGKTWTFCLNRRGNDVTNKTLGIVGMGRIGTELAKRAEAFDMRVVYHNRRKR